MFKRNFVEILSYSVNFSEHKNAVLPYTAYFVVLTNISGLKVLLQILPNILGAWSTGPQLAAPHVCDHNPYFGDISPQLGDNKQISLQPAFSSSRNFEKYYVFFLVLHFPHLSKTIFCCLDE